MAEAQVQWVPFTRSRIVEILGLMQEYYLIDEIDFNAATAEEALSQLLNDEDLGAGFFIELGGRCIGYLVTTAGFSLEYGGRYYFLDEFYIRAEHRSRGSGTLSMQFLELYCLSRNARSLHLEIEKINRRAQEFYRRHGFGTHDRFLWSKALSER